jgi:hypothetical protein
VDEIIFFGRQVKFAFTEQDPTFGGMDAQLTVNDGLWP